MHMHSRMHMHSTRMHMHSKRMNTHENAQRCMWAAKWVVAATAVVAVVCSSVWLRFYSNMVVVVVTHITRHRGMIAVALATVMTTAVVVVVAVMTVAAAVVATVVVSPSRVHHVYTRSTALAHHMQHNKRHHQRCVV